MLLDGMMGSRSIKKSTRQSLARIYAAVGKRTFNVSEIPGDNVRIGNLHRGGFVNKIAPGQYYVTADGARYAKKVISWNEV